MAACHQARTRRQGWQRAADAGEVGAGEVDLIPYWGERQVAILASGPSLSPDGVELVYERGTATIAINLSFRLAPWADIVYGCDEKFWDRYINEARETCTGLLLTQDALAADKYGIERIPSIGLPGLSKAPGVINLGGVPGSRSNSGYQAIGVAAQAHARSIYLLGFDMHDAAGSHWHGDHVAGLHEVMPFAEWLPAFDQLAADLQVAGIEVVNCTPGSALTCFPCAPF